MNRTITVKGIGSVSAKPDYITILFGIKSREKSYDSAMQMAAEDIERIQSAIIPLGFEKESIKTADFSINTVYESYRDENGCYRDVFAGYECRYDMKLSFDFDSGRLSALLSAISSCAANPRLDISFTVKDPAAVSDELLESAAENARHKASVLCRASGVSLGKLISIEYNWGELNIVSNTRYSMGDSTMRNLAKNVTVDIEPDDIKLRDTAEFTWEIE